MKILPPLRVAWLSGLAFVCCLVAVSVLRAAPSAEHGAGRTQSIPDLNLTLVWIEPGSFDMGFAGGDNDEKPVTHVTLSRGYWLGQTEVTQAQWTAVMGNNPSEFKGDERRPVENVNWGEAMEFCHRLTERERAAGRLPDGFAYTLPTEAQWENGCRAGTTGIFLGDLSVTAWCNKNSEETTHPVATKQANAWGLHDMQGNVWEICLNWYVPSHPGGSVTDPVGPTSAPYRVGRGGSFKDGVNGCRFTFRHGLPPDGRSSGFGFRLALSSVR